MTPQLNHTIVWSKDKRQSAEFLANVLGLPEPFFGGYFWVVELANGVSLDFGDKQDGPPAQQHYAFLVSDAEFDAGFQRIKDQGLTFWADPGCSQAGEINYRFGGRGVYFEDPSGHLLELLTQPYKEEIA